MSLSKEDIATLKKEFLKALLGSSREEAIAKAISDLSDEDKLAFFSAIDPEEIWNLTLMHNIAESYDLEWLKGFVNTQLKFRCSIGGWRAKQIENIASEKRRQERGLFARIFRRKDTKKDLLRREVEPFE